MQQGMRIPFHWSVADPSDSECPVSAITARSLELIQIVSTLQVAHESAGASIPAHEMPGSILDALRICEQESRVIDNAMEESLNR